MSNGFEMCDNHTYLFATEGKDCPYCEIDRLKGELEKAHTELAISIKERIDLGNQLAEARAEVEALTDVLNGSRKATYTAEMYDKGVAQARQEAAREILHIISMETMDRPFEQSQAVEIIRQHYILEG